MTVDIHFLDEVISFSAGLQKVGLGVAFINYHNRSKPLLHTIKVSKAKAVIVGPGSFPKISYNIIHFILQFVAYLTILKSFNFHGM